MNDIAEVLLLVLAGGVMWAFIAMLPNSKGRVPTAYWKIVLLTFAVTFVTASLWHKLSFSSRMVSSWMTAAAAGSVVFSLAEAGRRYGAKH
jgi:hypothetical protein